LAQHGVNRLVGFGDGIMAGFVFRFDCAEGETSEDLAGSIQCGLDALQSL
jgi:hypothetical protein